MTRYKKSNFVIFKKITFLLVLVSFFSCSDKEKYEKLEKELYTNNHTFSGSETCKTCHQNEYKSWEGSHHDLSMQIADSVSVLGNFNNIVFKSKGITYKFFKKGIDFYVNTEGTDGKYQDYKVANVFGVTPLQQYLINFPNGKKQCLSVAWDVKKQKWYDLQPNLKIHNEEWMHWTGGSMNWNSMCADCHSTNLQKKYNTITKSYNTTFSIINVSCESCHGASTSHINYYENNEKYKNIPPPKLAMETKMNSKELVDNCARCHSRRGQITEHFDYKGSFLDHYKPSLMLSPTYELDGQIKDEDYVYGSFVQSKMYHNNVSCKDCHNVHSLKLKKKGNALCLQCHETTYNEPSHHFHKKNTKASQCVNCHMTGKTYMGNDFRRDHSFRVPRPDQSVKYGTPNACNKCHKEKSAKWASDFIKEKYGTKRPIHFSDNLLAGYHNDLDAFKKVFSNTNNPNIIRATALNQFGDHYLAKNEIQAMLDYVNDASALVRNETIGVLDKQKQVDISEYIEPLLKDSIRLVRNSAVRYLDMRNKEVNQKALQEYETSLNVNADFASGQHQIALRQAKGNIDKAITAYKNAIVIDNYYNKSRINLALLYYQQGNIEKSKALYLKVIDQEPTYSYPYYMLGLLYNEIGDSKKALAYLSQAVLHKPANQNAFYNYALKLQENNQNKKALKIIDNGLQLFPNNERLLYVKLIGEMNLKLNKKAMTTCLKLVEIDNVNPQYLQILERLKLSST